MEHKGPPAQARATSRPDPVLLAILAMAAVLVLTGLETRHLWTDEAETACLARNVLRFGVPQAFDGVSYISQWVAAKREDFNEELVWVLSPWPQIYVTAASFSILGVGIFAARLPFALMALVDIWFAYRLALRIFSDRRVARLAAVLLCLCVPFLLHARQCRYYTLAMACALACLLSYLRLLARRPWGAAGLFLSTTLLFHANYGLCIPLLGAILLHALVFEWRRLPVAKTIAMAAAVAAFTLPYALYADILRTGSRLDTSYYAFNLLNYLIVINQYCLPLGLLLRRRKQGPDHRDRSTGILLLSICIVTNVLFVSTNVDYFFRYIIHLVPLLVILHAWILVGIADRAGQRMGRAGYAGVLLLAPLFILTTIPSKPVFPLLLALESTTDRHPFSDRPSLRRPRADLWAVPSEIFGFLHEITHDYDGPNKGIADFLRKNADPGDLVFTEYGDLPLLFSTEMEAIGGHQGIPYLGEPDWIVARAFMSPRILGEFAREHGYTEHVLEVADCHWENRPDPYAHRYVTAPLAPEIGEKGEGYPPVVIYGHPRKRPGGTQAPPSPDALELAPSTREKRSPRQASGVLLVTIDSLRADRILEWDKTAKAPPRIRRLADRSALFTSCVTPAPGTVPAAAALLSGHPAGDLGYPGVTSALGQDIPTLAGLLRDAGYETGAVLSTRALARETGLDRGFSSYLLPPEELAYRNDFAVAREARRWLLSIQGDRPFFLWVHFQGGHGPYARGINPFFSLVPISRRLLPARDGRRIPDILGDNSGRGGIPAYQELPGDNSIATYRSVHDMLALTADWFVQELLRTLEVLSASESTIVVVAGTHGESLGEEGVLFNHGEDLSLATIHVPLVIHVPGAPARTLETPVSTVDLLPTLLTLVGLPTPSQVKGRDLLGPGPFSAALTELRPPQGPERLLSILGPTHLVRGSSPETIETLALAWSRGSASGPGENDLRRLLLEALARPSLPAPPLTLDARRRAQLIELGYVAERLPDGR
jgi:hypothetical protein